MGTQYTNNVISGYNAIPPPDDASETASNLVSWSKHIDKIGDPCKNLTESINTDLVAHFDVEPGAAKTSGYTVDADDFARSVLCDATSAGFTVTLPQVAGVGGGFHTRIVKTDASINQITIDGNGSETLNGALTMVLSSRWDGIDLFTDGTEWFASRLTPFGSQPWKNVQDYGALADDSTDCKEAIESIYEECLTAGKGCVILFPPGEYKISDLGWLSFNPSTNGDYSDYMRDDLTIIAYGATITHSGTAAMFKFQCNSGGKHVHWKGGALVGTANTEALLKIRDGGQCSWNPDSIIACTGNGAKKGVGILMQNWYGFSENVKIGGAGNTIKMQNNWRGILLQNPANAEIWDTPETAPGGGTASMARLRIEDIQITLGQTGAVWLYINGASPYDGYIGGLSGNIDNGDATNGVIYHDVNLGSMLVDGFHAEGMSTSSAGYFMYRAGGTLAKVHDIAWGGSGPLLDIYGGGGVVKTMRWQNGLQLDKGDFSVEAGGIEVNAGTIQGQYFNTYNHNNTDIDDSGGTGKITLVNATITKILDNSFFSANDIFLIIVKDEGKTCFGACIAVRAQGTVAIRILQLGWTTLVSTTPDVAAATWVEFTDGGQHVNAEQNTGSDVDVHVSVIRLG